MTEYLSQLGGSVIWSSREEVLYNIHLPRLAHPTKRSIDQVVDRSIDQPTQKSNNNTTTTKPKMNLRINNKDVPLPKPYPVIPRQPRQKPMRVLALGLSRTGTLCKCKNKTPSKPINP